jgi:hypothetical protein
VDEQLVKGNQLSISRVSCALLLEPYVCFVIAILARKNTARGPKKSTRPARSGSSSWPQFRSTGNRRKHKSETAKPASVVSLMGATVDPALIASGGDGRDSGHGAFGPRRSSKNFSCRELRLQRTSAAKNFGYKSQSPLSSHPSWIATTPTFASKGSSSG